MAKLLLKNNLIYYHIYTISYHPYFFALIFSAGFNRLLSEKEQRVKSIAFD